MSGVSSDVGFIRSAKADAPYPAASYAWFVVVTLQLAYGVALVDRQIMSLLVQPVRADLNITDTEFSLIVGVAFALFYTTLGLFFGRRADTHNRRNMIVGGMVVWSLATAACGLASNFGELFAARMMVGVGEAVLGPAAYSMIADYFPRERRARAVSVYTMGVYLGNGAALIFGGAVVAATAHAETVVVPLVGAVRNWQAVFFVVSLPGLVVAAIMLMVREPIRRDVGDTQTTMRDVFAFVRRRARVLALTVAGVGMVSLVNIATATWIPTVFIRTHGWTAAQIGWAFGIILLTAGSAGVLFGGWWVGRPRASETPKIVLLTARNALLAVIPFAAITCLLPSDLTAVAALCGVAFAIGVAQTLVPVALYEITPNEFRGQVIAFYLLAGNLLGWSIGVPLVGAANDYLFGNDLAIGRSLALVLFAGCILGAVLLDRARSRQPA